MIDLNQTLRDMPGGDLLAMMMPQTYIATTLDDFVNNIYRIQPTVRGFLLRGRALIDVQSSLLYTPQKGSKKGSLCTLSDLTAYIDVSLQNPEKVMLMSIKEPERIYQAKLIYNVAQCNTSLILFSPNGPPTEKKSPVMDRTDILLSRT